MLTKSSLRMSAAHRRNDVALHRREHLRLGPADARPVLGEVAVHHVLQRSQRRPRCVECAGLRKLPLSTRQPCISNLIRLERPRLVLGQLPASPYPKLRGIAHRESLRRRAVTVPKLLHSP